MHLFASPKPALALKHKSDSLNTCVEAAETNLTLWRGHWQRELEAIATPRKQGRKQTSISGLQTTFSSSCNEYICFVPLYVFGRIAWMVYLHPRQWAVDKLHDSLEL